MIRKETLDMIDAEHQARLDAVKQQLAEAQKPDVCSVCAGDGEPVSELPCICGGTGTIYGEMQGLRKELVEANELILFLRTGNANMQKMIENGDDTNRQLRAENAKLKEALESIANSTCCGDCQEAKRVAISALKEKL